MKTVLLEASDKARNLKLSANAVCELEEKHGLKFDELQNGGGFREMRLILYALLKWENKNITLEEAGEIMDKVVEEKGFQYLGDKIAEAVNAYFGVEQAKKRGK